MFCMLIQNFILQKYVIIQYINSTDVFCFYLLCANLNACVRTFAMINTNTVRLPTYSIVMNTIHIFSFLSLLLFFQSLRGETLVKSIKYNYIGETIAFDNSVASMPGYLDVYSGKHPVNSSSEFLSATITVLEASVCNLPSGIKFSPFSSDSARFDIVCNRGDYFLEYSFSPFFVTDGQFYKIDSYQVNYNLSSRKLLNASRLKSSVSSPLSSGQWVKVKLQRSGIYKISGSDLKSYGFSSVSSVRIFGDDGGMLPLKNGSELSAYMPEVPLVVNDGGDGVFDNTDYVLFYGQNPNTISYSSDEGKYVRSNNCYTQYSYFLITVNNGQPKRISSADYSNLSADAQFDYYDDVQVYEGSDTNIVMSGREWYESAGNRTYSFNFPNFASGKTSNLSYRVLGTSETGFGYSVNVNESLIANGNISKGEGSTSSGRSDFILQQTNASVRVSRSSTNKFWLDYLLLSVPSQIRLQNGQLVMRNSVSASSVAAEYILPSGTLSVWDVTDFSDVRTISLNGSTFKAPGGALRTFVLFDGSEYLTPEFVEAVSNQNLAGATTAEYIIVAHPDFAAQANRLANLHANVSGISTLVVTQDQIFNEFSSGRPDVAAVRNYLRYMYSRDGKLRYLLMFGDGSYDNSELSSKSNQLITYQSLLSSNTGSFVSDDFFGMLDAGEGESGGLLVGDIDLGVGRLPVSSVDRAKLVVDKIVHYASSPESRGSWRNNMAFLADDGDAKLHITQANQLADSVEAARGEVISNKILSEAFKSEASSGGMRYPDVNLRILDVIKKGVLLFNYTGHGNPVQFGGERFVTAPDLKEWNNMDKLPLVITASCEVGRYDNPGRLSLGELLLLQEEGGAIALLTTTRLVYAYPNFQLNKEIISELFGQNEWGSPKTMGDIVRVAKNNIGYEPFQNKRNFSLLGDPALRLSAPQAKVVTDSINGQHVSVFKDTVSALSEVRISGHIEYANGGIYSTYSGVVFPSVLDKYRIMNTLPYQGEDLFEYKEYANTLFKGQATVKNGYFNFKFLVPKDISYRFDYGKISYYADNGTEDGSGFENRILVGGSNSNIVADDAGPELSLYMNDSSFVFGGTTDESPLLLVKTKDDSGINIAGNSVGHDITAILDADVSNTYVLNDFYQADMDSYKHGAVRYPLTALAEGKHTVKVKVWDAQNNSSEDFLEFFVSESAELALKHVLNYPNPFSTSTAFYFENNQAGQNLDIIVQIFTVSGKLVKSIESTQYATGFRSQPISWDGRDDYGDRIGRGVYFYRVKVRTEDGSTAEAYEKLVVLQ